MIAIAVLFATATAHNIYNPVQPSGESAHPIVQQKRPYQTPIFWINWVHDMFMLNVYFIVIGFFVWPLGMVLTVLGRPQWFSGIENWIYMDFLPLSGKFDPPV